MRFTLASTIKTRDTWREKAWAEGVSSRGRHLKADTEQWDTSLPTPVSTGSGSKGR